MYVFNFSIYWLFKFIYTSRQPVHSHGLVSRNHVDRKYFKLIAFIASKKSILSVYIEKLVEYTNKLICVFHPKLFSLHSFALSVGL